MKNLNKVFQLTVLLLIIMQPVLSTAQSNQYLHFDGDDDFTIS